MTKKSTMRAAACAKIIHRTRGPQYDSSTALQAMLGHCNAAITIMTNNNSAASADCAATRSGSSTQGASRSDHRAATRAGSRKNRVFVFREFLWKTYGNPSLLEGSDSDSACYLKPGDMVLDVAGGKGDLSWLLRNVDGMSSVVVVDPRSMSSKNHLIKSVHWLADHPEEAKQRAISGLPSYQPIAALLPQILERKAGRFQHQDQTMDQRKDRESPDNEYLEPRHMKIKLNNQLVEALRKAKQEQVSSCSSSSGVMESSPPPSWRQFWDQLMLQDDDNINPPPKISDPCFLPESERKDDTGGAAGVIKPIQDAAEAWNVFQSVRLIVGFHPDQATEPCLDLAEALRIPLCIVPCCVFPSEFPHRQVAVKGKYGTVTMTRVRDYQLFLQYLQNKQPKLRNAKLPFVHFTGTPLKNVVLYTLPEDIIGVANTIN